MLNKIIMAIFSGEVKLKDIQFEFGFAVSELIILMYLVFIHTGFVSFRIL